MNINGVFSQYVVPIVLKGWPGSRVKSLVYINMSSYLLYFLLLNFAAPFLTNARALPSDFFTERKKEKSECRKGSTYKNVMGEKIQGIY